MQPKFHSVDQNSEEWYNLRMGKFTASSFSDLFMGKSTQGYQKAINKVVFERLTNELPESFSNEYMERGHELEPLAREQYEIETFNTVEDGGFWSIGDYVGASPDGLVGHEGLLEIKSPAYNTMINYLLKNELPKQYYWQVHGQMYVTGRKWCDFVAYHPKLKLLVVRVHRNEDVIEELKNKLSESIKEVNNRINLIKEL